MLCRLSHNAASIRGGVVCVTSPLVTCVTVCSFLLEEAAPGSNVARDESWGFGAVLLGSRGV
eukprot:7742217-Prorocentrum_lima.AAC.1